MKTRREETGDVADSILEKYQVLVEETVPALNKHIAQLERKIKRIEMSAAKVQPKAVRHLPKRKQKP